MVTSAPATSGTPPPEVIALNRIAFGPRAGDPERVRTVGLTAYVDEQLAPEEADDPRCQARLKSARLLIEHGAGKGYKAVKERRPLAHLDKPVDQLWRLTDQGKAMDWTARVRPAEEVRAAAWIRAVYSRWQLREVLVDFWHNHFNVNAFSDERIAATWPAWDRTIREHCLGNFRAFLEAVATSPAMLYYLDNATSKASPANENYARELFELHTLGAAHYLNHLYNRWRDVPGAREGRAAGYIDQDVYEAARAFTGWTVADGTDTGRGDVFRNTGAFHYYDGWHDPYQKRVLGVEFEAHAPALADGRRVLDLVAFHPGTARHVCRKLCQRLVADDPPSSLVERAARTWTAAHRAPDQIRQTVRTILLAPEFTSTWGGKVKRPFELVTSFLRAVDAEVAPNADLTYLVWAMGQRLFDWPTPNGHPDTAELWLGTNVTLGRWNTLASLVWDGLNGAASVDLRRQMPPGTRTARQVADFWVDRLLGRPVAPHAYRELLQPLTDGGAAADRPLMGNAEEIETRLKGLVTLIGMTPDFQWR